MPIILYTRIFHYSKIYTDRTKYKTLYSIAVDLNSNVSTSTLSQIQKSDIYNNLQHERLSCPGQKYGPFVNQQLDVQHYLLHIRRFWVLTVKYKCWSQILSTPGSSRVEIWNNCGSSRERGGVSHSEVLQTQHQTFPTVAKSLSYVLWVLKRTHIVNL